MLTASLIASATFVIVALEAFHLDAGGDVQDKSSGTGGFTVFAESAVPLPYDLNTPEGRRSLGIDELPVGRDQGIEGSREQDQVPIGEVEAKGEDAQPGFAAYSFRLRPGDESSCLNLYVPVQPRVIGAPASFIERGGFAFSGSTAETEIERANPWRLLDKNLAADVIPAIGDEAAVLWQLHSGLGQDFTISDERGRSVQLRFVALLKGSVLQDEIVISETNLTRLFPGIEGHSFFLVETPTNQAERVERSLEKDLERFGLDAGSTATRLAAYNAVQNTYLSTFQTLGGLGLILGTFGLAAILLRNVWERRRELALMRATGFTRGSLAATVMSENLLLVAVGLVSGSLAAAIAVAPRLASQPESVPVASLALLLLLVLAAGVLSASLGILSTLRLNLVASLRAE